MVTQELIDLIKQISNEVVEAKLTDNQVLAYKSVIVSSYNTANKTATIIIPPDMDTVSIYSYPNRSGHTLATGQKIYLAYMYGNVSQGYLVDNKPI